MSTLYSLQPSPARLSTKIWCFYSYFHLVLLLKQNLVLLFVFSSSSSRAISFHICILLKYLSATPLNQSVSSKFVMLIIRTVNCPRCLFAEIKNLIASSKYNISTCFLIEIFSDGCWTFLRSYKTVSCICIFVSISIY